MGEDQPTERGMPKWRARQRALSVGEKVELIGKFIQETRQLELVKKRVIRQA